MEHRKSRWLWPIPPLSLRNASTVYSLAMAFDRSTHAWMLYALSGLIGSLPIALAAFVHFPVHQWLTTALFFPIYLGCVAAHRPLRALLLLCTVISAHSATVIACSYVDPKMIAATTPGAEPFWQESLHWIETGEQLEYRLDIWLPKHMLLIVAVAALGYCSLGLTVLHRGFEEVDLMNYYVGRLLAHSDHAAAAFVGGWHLWSLLRGVGYAILLFEIAAFSLHRLVGGNNYPMAASLQRCVFGLSFLALDVLCKFVLMEPVRQMLNSHLTR